MTIADTDLGGDNTPEYNGKTETITVTITEKDTAALTVSQSGWTYGDTNLPDPVYTEPAETTSTTVVYSGTNSSDKPTAAGNYTVTVTCETADTIYTGTASFTIKPKDISGAKVTLDNTSLTYTGAEQTVSVTGVTVDGVSLTASDYTVGGTASGTARGPIRSPSPARATTPAPPPPTGRLPPRPSAFPAPRLWAGTTPPATPLWRSAA